MSPLRPAHGRLVQVARGTSILAHVLIKMMPPDLGIRGTGKALTRRTVRAAREASLARLFAVCNGQTIDALYGAFHFCAAWIEQQASCSRAVVHSTCFVRFQRRTQSRIQDVEKPLREPVLRWAGRSD